MSFKIFVPCVIIRTAFSSFLYIDIPFDTVLIASTSSPESVSSSIANLGFRVSICKISSFFFSPPENPTFKSLVLYTGFMSSFFIFSSSSFLKANILTGSPVTDVFAAFRKLVTDIPGTSSGV